MSELERITRFEPAWDKRNFAPQKNYGIHSVEVHFILKGPEGAVRLSVDTGWHLPEIQKDLESRRVFFGVYGQQISYHSKVSRGDGQTAQDCDLLEGGQCFGDLSYIQSGDFVAILVAQGSDALWAALEAWYASRLSVSTVNEGSTEHANG